MQNKNSPFKQTYRAGTAGSGEEMFSHGAGISRGNVGRSVRGLRRGIIFAIINVKFLTVATV
jgi:hypothetical protein